MELNPDFLTTSVTASCSLFLHHPLSSCRLLVDPQTRRHCFILRLKITKTTKNLWIDFAWQDFPIKQDQSSSRRSAERTFIDFITTQGIVQRQRVCMPFFSRHYSMLCSLFHMFLSLKESQRVFKWLLLAREKMLMSRSFLHQSEFTVARLLSVESEQTAPTQSWFGRFS